MMGTKQSKEIPRTSPSACVLAHWKELAGYDGIEKKKALVKFCTQWWPLHSLEKGVRWPPAGTLDDETVSAYAFLETGTEVGRSEVC